MDITIIETNEKTELSIIDRKSGVNWVNDLLGNHDALPDYNDDDGTYHMPQEDFDWWDNLIKEYQASDDRYYKILDQLKDPDYENMIAEFQNINCDLEDLPGYTNQICDEYEKMV